MKLTRAIFLVATVMGALPAHAELSVLPTLVRSGFFLASDCSPSMSPRVANECICEANIKRAQITGITPEAASAINATLSLLPEKLSVESCEGTPTPAPAAGIKVNQASADFKIAYHTPESLTVLITYSTYGVGGEYPLSGTEGFTFELVRGALIDPIMLMKPEMRTQADRYLKQELLKKFSTALYDEAKTRTDPYLTENGCDGCTMFYTKEGWVVRFQISAVAPYALGEPEITMPLEVVPPPEKLLNKG